MTMRWALASLGLHLGLLAAAWVAMAWQPENLSYSEASVSIDIIAMEDAVEEPSQTISDSSANLVSAGVTQAASEAVEEVAEAVEPVEMAEAQAAQPVEVAAAVPVSEPVEPVETEELVSAEVLAALSDTIDPIVAPVPQVTDAAAPTVVETVAPTDAPILERLEQVTRFAELAPEVEPITTASISQLTPVEPVESRMPVKVATLSPVIEETALEEVVDAPPVPMPRLVREPVAEEQPVEKPAKKKPVEKKTADKPVEKQQVKKVASLGSGGEAEADSSASTAAAGKGKAAGGKGKADAYPGQVFAKLSKAVRRPKGSFDGGEVRIMFTLNASGDVIKTALARSSGDAKVDEAAFAAVARAAFPPIPAAAGKSTWSFTFPLVIR